MIIQCPKCGNLVSDKATVCPSCGTSLTTNLSAPTTTDYALPDTTEVAQPETPKEQPTAKSTTGFASASSAQTLPPSDSWASDIDEHKKGNRGIIVAIVVTAVAFLIGVFFLIRFLNSPSHKLSKVPGLFDKQQYEQVATICDEVLSSYSSLNDQNKQDLAIYYGQLSRQSGNKEYQKKFTSYIKTMYDLNDSYTTHCLERIYPDEINHIRIHEAYEYYSSGDWGNAKSLCSILSGYSDNLSFTDKCDLASLLCAISNVNNDNNLKKECAILYTQTCNYNEEEAKERYAINDERLRIDIASVVESVKTPQQEKDIVLVSTPIRSVVVTGTNVRVRKGPGLNYDPITDFYGKNIHPDKGQRLEYLGEATDFYRVRFRGHECWISKQFAIASTDPVK